MESLDGFRENWGQLSNVSIQVCFVVVHCTKYMCVVDFVRVNNGIVT